MRSLKEIQAEANGLARNIGYQNFELDRLKNLMDNLAKKLQGNLERLKQLDTEPHEDSYNESLLPEMPLNLPETDSEPESELPIKSNALRS